MWISGIVGKSNQEFFCATLDTYPMFGVEVDFMLSLF